MNIAQHHQSAFSICVRIYGGIRSLCNITFAHIFSMTISFSHAFWRVGEKINRIIVCAVVVSQESSVILFCSFFISCLDLSLMKDHYVYVFLLFPQMKSDWDVCNRWKASIVFSATGNGPEMAQKPNNMGIWKQNKWIGMNIERRINTNVLFFARFASSTAACVFPICPLYSC